MTPPSRLNAYHWHAVSFGAPASGAILAESETTRTRARRRDLAVMSV
ncbi:MAG TPA: hypothetical protein VN615_15685 [Gaiellales bacterium]|nr:hypothetical protein [Gaiellales bacterium]